MDPCIVAATGADGRRMARRAVVDVSLGGLGMELHQSEQASMAVGTMLSLQVEFRGVAWSVGGRITHLSHRGGSRVAGVVFLEEAGGMSVQLALRQYLLRLLPPDGRP